MGIKKKQKVPPENKAFTFRRDVFQYDCYLFLFYLRCILSLPGGSQIFQQRPAHHRAGSFGKRQPQCPATGSLPSYMKVITLTTVAKYNLTLTKGTGISIMYYKINGSNTYASTTNSSITVSVNEGSTYYYYGIASTGYAMNSCSLSSGPCSGTMGASAVTKTLTASANSYNLTLSKGTGVSTIYYRVNGATNYSSSTASKTVAVKYGTTYYYYGTASTGYTMSSCTLSSPCSGTMGAGAVTKSLTATANSYNLTLNKGTGVSTIYYKVNGASSYTSSTSNKTLSVKYGTTYYYYGTASTGYTMNSCTSSSPCSGTMGTSAVTKTLTAKSSGGSGPFTVTLYVDDTLYDRFLMLTSKLPNSFSA